MNRIGEPDPAINLWSPVLPAAQAEDAVACVVEVAERINTQASRDALAAVLPGAPWAYYSISSGLAQGRVGLAVMCGYLDACLPGRGWDAAAHDHMALAARDVEKAPFLPAGLWSGLAGTAFAARYLSRDGTRYRNLSLTLEEVLLPGAIEQARHLATQRNGVKVSDYDLISGVTGIGAYLLLRRGDARAAEALLAVIQSLISLAGGETSGPAWYSPPEMLDVAMRRRFPEGNLNCGLAHGIPGPLALLALAHRDGIATNGMLEAMERMAAWLAAQQIEDTWGINWPTAVSLNPAHPGSGHNRSAWCYGSAGVARALWLAGEALSSPGYRKLAVEAMEAIYRRPIRARGIDSAPFCHGVAGLLQVTLRFAHDTRAPQFIDAARALTGQLLDLYQPDSPLGYRAAPKPARSVDRPDLLDGAAGVAMVLLAAATGADPGWDRLFLLS